MPQQPLRFLQAHAMHPRPELALELVWAQLASQGAASMGATLGWCYLGEDLAEGAAAILAGLRARLPGVAWVGAVGAGVLATGVEYIDEPALAVMLCNLPTSRFRIFHGRQPMPIRSGGGAAQGQWQAATALVHADGQSIDLPDLIEELAARTSTASVFGGISSGPSPGLHMALDPVADLRATEQAQAAEAQAGLEAGVWRGGVSGVAFSSDVRLVTRLTQGCEPIGPRREITAAHRNIVYELDGLPALSCLLRDLDVAVTVQDAMWQREALPKVRATLVGISPEGSPLLSHGQHLSDEALVRHLIGLDPGRGGVVVSDTVSTGMQLAFCQRHAQAARQDLVRICSEIREEFDPLDHPGSQPVGAVYISCAGRGGPHFGAPHAELELISHALGDIPLVGMFANGEIAGHGLYGYSGVLTVFGS
jgi:small ligand-binding sensory domain FIST